MKFIKVGLLLVIPLLLLATFVVLATGAIPYKVYVIHTGSMTPTIPSGSAVIVHEGHYRIGQVITFHENGLTVTHRLVSINAQGLTTTKGDANATVDPWHVSTSQIVGDVVAAPRYLGYWITYLKSPLGLGSVVLVFFVLWQVWTISEGAPDDAEGDEGRNSHSSGRWIRRKATGKPSMDAVAEPDEVAATTVGGGASFSAIDDQNSTVTRAQGEGNNDVVGVESSVLTLSDVTRSTTISGTNDDGLDNHIDADHFESAIVTREQLTAHAGEPRAPFEQENPLPDETILGDESASDVLDERSNDDHTIVGGVAESPAPSHVGNDVQERARLAKLFGVVPNGSNQASRGRSI